MICRLVATGLVRPHHARQPLARLRQPQRQRVGRAAQHDLLGDVETAVTPRYGGQPDPGCGQARPFGGRWRLDRRGAAAAASRPGLGASRARQLGRAGGRCASARRSARQVASLRRADMRHRPQRTRTLPLVAGSTSAYDTPELALSGNSQAFPKGWRKCGNRGCPGNLEQLSGRGKCQGSDFENVRSALSQGDFRAARGDRGRARRLVAVPAQAAGSGVLHVVQGLPGPDRRRRRRRQAGGRAG